MTLFPNTARALAAEMRRQSETEWHGGSFAAAIALERAAERRERQANVAVACFADPTCTAVDIEGQRFERPVQSDGRASMWL